MTIAARLPGVGPDPVVEVLAAHHIQPHYDRATKTAVWRCTCGDEWPTSEHTRWQPVEDEHQADMLRDAHMQVGWIDGNGQLLAVDDNAANHRDDCSDPSLRAVFVMAMP